MKRIALFSIHLLVPALCFGMQIKKTKKPYYYCCNGWEHGSADILTQPSHNKKNNNRKNDMIPLDPCPIQGDVGKYQKKIDFRT
ncbi:MAG TPA: hypothetical protein VKU36_02375 [Candidatus Babeliales bacterium]|nr:hypothetical protein [Candidatus Babeliales bacterium]